MTDTERKSWQGKAPNQHFLCVNGQQIAHINEAGLLNVADALSGFDSSELGASVTPVQDGENLQAVAQRVLRIYRGKIRMCADFNEPLPEEFLLSGRL